MVIDPTTNLGKLRLRVGDFSDLSYLPDSVYLSTLEDTGNNLTRSTKIIANYILAMLAHKTHRKMAQLEVWGAEAFKNYKEFLMLTIKDPAFMDLSPIPLVTSDPNNPLIDFQKHWNANFVGCTESEQLARNAWLNDYNGCGCE